MEPERLFLDACLVRFLKRLTYDFMEEEEK
jgi:hypothetical protein